jgi:glycosyltransferase involved in cell wall biosynthesis
MKILGIPRKNRDLGSCRIRYYTFLENLPKDWTYESYEEGKKCDAIYIQKLIDERTIRIVERMKRLGVPVIYDRDDFQQKWKPLYRDIIDHVAAVTTDTEANAELIRHHTMTPVFVISDCLDYGVAKKDRARIRDRVSRITTYGRQANVQSIAPYYGNLRGISTTYICDRSFKSLRSSKFIEWNRKTFLKKLAKHDLVILTHNEDYRVPYKPNTRMVVAMSVGLPVLASPSAEFERTLKEVGHPELLIKDPRNMLQLVELLQNKKKRQKISDTFFEYAWENYRPESSAKKLVEVIKEVGNARRIM